MSLSDALTTGRRFFGLGETPAPSAADLELARKCQQARLNQVRDRVQSVRNTSTTS
jgi:hypothetical protein